jgi:hypothetical protein
LICLVEDAKDLEGLVNKMDIELMEYIEQKWGIYEAALAEKDARFLNRHQHTMALVRTVASASALIVSLIIAYKVW